MTGSLALGRLTKSSSHQANRHRSLIHHFRHAPASSKRGYLHSYKSGLSLRYVNLPVNEFI